MPKDEDDEKYDALLHHTAERVASFLAVPVEKAAAALTMVREELEIWTMDGAPARAVRSAARLQLVRPLKSYTDEEESAVADQVMIELGVPLNRDTDIWRSLKLGIAKGIGMGYDKMTELVDSR